MASGDTQVALDGFPIFTALIVYTQTARLSTVSCWKHRSPGPDIKSGDARAKCITTCTFIVYLFSDPIPHSTVG